LKEEKINQQKGKKPFVDGFLRQRLTAMVDF
jgi:hypothetical protein